MGNSQSPLPTSPGLLLQASTPLIHHTLLQVYSTKTPPTSTIAARGSPWQLCEISYPTPPSFISLKKTPTLIIVKKTHAVRRGVRTSIHSHVQYPTGLHDSAPLAVIWTQLFPDITLPHHLLRWGFKFFHLKCISHLSKIKLHKRKT